MGYLLVDYQTLESKGIKYTERVPDGRGIVDFTMLRVIGSVNNVQIIGSKKELDKLILEQKESGLYDTPTILPETGEEFPLGTTDETPDTPTILPETDETANVVESTTEETEIVNTEKEV